MELIDKLVLQTEQEIGEYKRQREHLQSNVQDTLDKIKSYEIKEKEARKLLKVLRAKQPKRSTPLKDSSRNEIDYDGALELLSEQETFKQSELESLIGADSKTVNNKLRWLRNKNKVILVQTGKMGHKDSAIYKVVRND
jgi:hypothetical protein